MKTTIAEKIASAEAQLVEIRKEQQRKIGYAGVRFSVFARLRELARDEKRITGRIEALRRLEFKP